MGDNAEAVPIDIENDGLKTHLEITQDLYQHTDNKIELEKNMMTMAYLKSPKKFNEKDD